MFIDKIMKVSIVVPCYKNEDTIASVVRDIRQQTYRDWELIVVGNGPNQDAQREIVESESEEDTRIIYLSIEEKGVSRARNKGVSVATGEWLAFVDADDCVPSRWLENFLSHASKSPDIIIGGISYKNLLSGKVKRADLALDFEEVYSDVASEFIPLFLSDMAATYSPCTKLYNLGFIRRSKILFRDDISIYEDGIFNLQLALECCSMCFFRQTGYEYCLHPGSSSIGQFHSSMTAAVKIRRELQRKVLLRGGFGEMEIDRKMAGIVAGDALDTILNLYRVGSGSSFFDKRRRLKRVYNDSELINAWKVFNPPMSNIPLVLFRIFHALRAPTFCLATFHLLFAVRNLWRKINEAVRFS
jgi:glycosyltransferase involved in cell wall biosynthesis